ncbi:MAG: DUF3566 domain-containing protein [Calditrichota bacterium]
MIREIRRIEPVSAIRVGFFIGLLSGFIFGLVEGTIIKAIAQSGGMGLLPQGAESLVNLQGGALVILAVVTGLVFSLLFALTGGLLTIFYNWSARLFGGIEMHMDAEPAPPPASSDNSSAWDDDSKDD